MTEKKDSDVPLGEKPQNGVAGLKHIRNDILSGIVVSLVSLPLSSGIAIASGCPPHLRADVRDHRGTLVSVYRRSLYDNQRACCGARTSFDGGDDFAGRGR